MVGFQKGDFGFENGDFLSSIRTAGLTWPIFHSVCAFFCLNHLRVPTATRRYPAQGYQGLQRQAAAESVSGLVEGHFGTETIHSLVDCLSLSVLPVLSISRKTLLCAHALSFSHSFPLATPLSEHVRIVSVGVIPR